MMNKKIKLTKLTVANLERAKGGIDHCACNYGLGDNAYNQAVKQSLIADTVCNCG